MTGIHDLSGGGRRSDLSPVYTITFWARLALGTVPLFFGTALHVYTDLFAVPV